MKEDLILEAEDIENVLSRIEVGNEDDCWNWTLRTNNVGRPIYSIKKETKTFTLSVQRIVLEHYLGHTVASRYIDTSCENLGCCNPKHFKGT